MIDEPVDYSINELIERLDTQVNALAKALMVVKPTDLDVQETTLLIGDLRRIIVYVQNANGTLWNVMSRNKAKGNDLNKRLHDEMSSIEFKEQILTGPMIIRG